MAESLILSAPEHRISEILDVIEEAVFALDADERFLFANRKALEMWAKKEIELTGQRILDVFPEIKKSDPYRAYRSVQGL